MSGNKILTFVAIFVLIGVFGYVLYNSQKAAMSPIPSSIPSTTTSEMMSPSPAAVKELVVMLKGQNKSTESGKAVLTEENGKVKVVLDLTGAPKGISQPAHIHVGKCPDVGAVKYPLTSLVDGKSETILDTTLDKLKSESPLGLNVHKSAAEAKVYVSCGDLIF